VAGVGEQMAREVDWTHHESNAGGGAAIGDAGETAAALPPRLGFRRREVQCR
jgi:hypothetical protein